MEFLFIILLPVIMVILLLATSKGECYFCGHRFEEGEVVLKTLGEKTCSDCYSKGRYRGDRR